MKEKKKKTRLSPKQHIWHCLGPVSGIHRSKESPESKNVLIKEKHVLKYKETCT